MTHVLIIGNGVAGISTARHIRKNADHRITVVSEESEFFFSRTALMYVFMGHMKPEHTQPYEKHFWKKNRIELVHDQVKSLDFQNKKAILKNAEISYDILVLATGSKTRTLNLLGEECDGILHLYTLQDVEKLEAKIGNTTQTAVVGGGLIGIELCEMLLSRHKKVKFIIREKAFMDFLFSEEESDMLQKHMVEHGLELMLSEEIEEIKTENYAVNGLKLKSGKNIDCGLLGICIGVEPNLQFLKNEKALEIERGILVNEYLETSISDVYAAGDCVQLRRPANHRRATEPIWYTAKKMGETIGQTIAGNKKAYEQGIFFNSAKFFDIEYQTYGYVPARASKEIQMFYWKHATANISMRIAFEAESRVLLGVNVFGLRQRQEVWERWISDGSTIDKVIGQMKASNFDPEFSKRYEHEILKKFNEEQYADR
jgi:3-phenylpropionate/trans-cinnamate dioxygenase ferredoxin reductase component